MQHGNLILTKKRYDKFKYRVYKVYRTMPQVWFARIRIRVRTME